MRPQRSMQNPGIASVVTSMAVGLALVLGGVTMGFAQELTQAELFFELNDTDGDLGIHANIDGDPYVRLKIEDPQERVILNVTASGRLGMQGLTQLSFESAEPPFDELSSKEFFKRFPEGVYEIEVVDEDGVETEARVRLSHILAAPPKNVTAGGVAAVKCDEVPPAVGTPGQPVLIDWDPVTTSHPTIGTPNKPVTVSRYQVFVEQVGGPVKFGIDLPPTVTQFEVPGTLTALGGVIKYEIITRTRVGSNPAGNNTAVEHCFQVQ